MTEPATAGTAIRDVPLSRLALAPENVRRTAPDAADQQQLQASIVAHGLLENLVARIDTPADDGTERFAVVAGGRRLVAMQALAQAGELDPDHPVPCKIATDTDGAEISLAENTVRIAMHPADQVVAFSPHLPPPAPPSRPSPPASASPSEPSSAAWPSATPPPSSSTPTAPTRSISPPSRRSPSPPTMRASRPYGTR